MSADLVLRGGRIFTAVGHRPFCSALAASAGRVVAVGDERDVEHLVGPSTRTIELEGRLALPGFHDAHTHLLGAGLTLDELSLIDLPSPGHCRERVRARVQERGPKEWVVGRGWDPDLFPGGKWPDRRLLDAVAPGTPVLLFRRDGHAAWVNTRALELAGITAATGDPPHGRIVRDERGELTGILLEEPAIALVRACVPAPSLERRVKAAERGIELARTLGVTSIQDDASYDDRLEPGKVYGELLGRGQLTARVTLWQRLDRDLASLREERAALPAQHGVPRLSYGLLKGYLDGSLGSRTALLHTPYDDAPCEPPGIPLIEPDELSVQVRRAHEAGFQVGLHAIGDRAAALALDAFAGLARVGPPEAARAARHRIEHVQVLRREDIARFAVLGVIASVQPIHLASDMKIARSRLGERTGTSYPWRSLLDSGAQLAFGTDYPVEPLDPLPGVFCAVSRRSPREAGDAYHVEQALTREEAFLAYGAGSAFAAHSERFLGRLAPGFQADIAVLSRDVFALAPDEIPGARCDVTIVDGEVVFQQA